MLVDDKLVRISLLDCISSMSQISLFCVCLHGWFGFGLCTVAWRSSRVALTAAKFLGFGFNHVLTLYFRDNRPDY